MIFQLYPGSKQRDEDLKTSMCDSKRNQFQAMAGQITPKRQQQEFSCTQGFCAMVKYPSKDNQGLQSLQAQQPRKRKDFETSV